MSTWYTIDVALRTGNRTITSPSFESKDEALAALNAIREAAKSGDWIELDWLTVNGGEVVVAHLEEHDFGIG